MNVHDFTCPSCGNEVSPNAAGCGKCGARREKDGQWFLPDTYDGIDLGDDFDYEAFVEQEFGGGRRKMIGREFFWWIVAVVVLVAFFLLSIGAL